MNEIRVNTNGIALQVRDYEGEGDPIIFLHFSGANLMMWQRAMPYFEQRYRPILVDLRGHGKSDRPETGYHIDELARDVVGVMQHLDLPGAHVVGSSLGAEVGLSMAANYPAKVLSLVCDGAFSSEFGPYGLWEGSESDFQEHVARQLEKIRSNPERSFLSVDALVEERREILEKYGLWNEHVEALERYGAYRTGNGYFTKGFRQEALADYMANYFQIRFEDYYRRVKCPLLMVPGEHELENERGRVVMEGLRALAGEAEVVAISGWLHPYGWLLDPESMSGAILRFLGRTTGG